MINQQQIGSILNHHSQLQYEDIRVPCYIEQDFSQWRTSSYPLLRSKKSQFFPQISSYDYFKKQDKLYLPPNKLANHRRYSFLRGIICHISQEQYKKNKKNSQSQGKQQILVPKQVRLSLPSAYQFKQKIQQEKQMMKRSSCQFSTLKKMPFSFVKIRQKRNASMLQKISQPDQDILKNLKEMDKSHKKGKVHTFITRRKFTNRQHRIPKQKQTKCMFNQCIKPINLK